MQRIKLGIILIMLLIVCNCSKTIEPTENLINKIDNKCDKKAVKCLNSFWIYNCEKTYNDCMDKLDDKED